MSKTSFAENFPWTASVTCFRLSILALYTEIFTKRSFIRSATVVQSLVVLWFAASIVAFLLDCRSIRKRWDKDVPGKCGNATVEWLSFAGVHMVFDLVSVLLPLPIIWRLQMPTRKKFGVSMTFALGLW